MKLASLIVFTGDVDDSFRLEIGGQTLVSQIWGDVPASGQGIYESDSLVPSVSGWYTVTAFHDNEAGPGNASISVKVDGNAAVELNTDNFDIVPDVSSLDGKANIGSVVEHASEEGGYYPAFDINEGMEDTFINVSKITTQLVDTDGSETLKLVLDGLPEGAVVKLGDSELVVNSNGRVNISSWLSEGGKVETILDEIQIKVDEPDTYTVKVKAISDETVGDTIEVTQGSFELIVHPVKYAPLVGNTDVNLSEEGLNGGLEDDAGKGSLDDTTNSTSISGSISVSDQNGDDVSVAFEKPTETLYSGDTKIIWTLSDDNQTLEGHAGSELVISATIDNQGGYDIDLLAPINHSDTTGEDTESFTIPVTGSDGELTGKGAISVTIEDDAPDAGRVHHDVSAETKEGANVQLILDVSDSMSWSAYDGDPDLDEGEPSRLDIMQDAAIKMLRQYEASGATKVQIVLFSSGAVLAGGNSNWMSVDDAIEIITNLDTESTTDYDDAIKKAAESWGTASDDDGKLENATNVSYFLSDGNPTSNDGGNPNTIEPNELSNWISHLTGNDITSLAYGMGKNVDTNHLDQVAFDGSVQNASIGGQGDTNSTVVADITQLPPIMLQSVIHPVEGNLLTDQEGADGADISQLTINGVTYNFDGINLTVSDNNDDVSHLFDADTKTLTILIDSKHSLVIDLDDGGYKFFGAQSSQAENLEFGYTLTDTDGDSSSNVLSFEVTEASDGNDVNTPPVAKHFTVSSDTNVANVNFAPHATDTEDDASTTDNKHTSVRIEELPEHGKLYEVNDKGEIVGDALTVGKVVLDSAKIIYVANETGSIEHSADFTTSGFATENGLNEKNDNHTKHPGVEELSLDGVVISGGKFDGSEFTDGTQPLSMITIPIS